MLLSSYAYICFSLLIKADFNAVICAVLLLLLIWAMDYLFSLCFKKNDLGISEKKRYIFMAYVGACISGFIIASRDASKMALEIPNITISRLMELCTFYIIIRGWEKRESRIAKYERRMGGKV